MAASLPPQLRFQPLLFGFPLPAAKVYFYAAGTSTPQAVYAADGVTPLANPLSLDSNGCADFRLGSGLSYKINLTTFNDIQLPGWPVDNIDAIDKYAISLINTLKSDLSDSSDLAKGDALITVKQPLTGSKALTQHAFNSDFVLATHFTGVDSTGVTDSTTGLAAAVASGAKRIRIPAGTYKLNATITIPPGLIVEGDGEGVTILDFTLASGLTDGRCVVSDGGSLVALPARTTDILTNQRTITFASAPSVVPGDVIVIYNNANGSWNSSRDAYHAGEMCAVALVAGSTITLQGTIADDYLLSASVSIYKLPTRLTTSVSNLSIYGNGSTTSPCWGLTFRNLINPKAIKVSVSKASYSQIEFHRCFNFLAYACNVQEDFIDSFGGDYGLVVANCHIGFITCGYFASSRHGITTGGYSGAGDIVNRYIHVHHCHISTSGASQAMDYHGNIELSTVEGCVIDGGCVLGGNRNSIINNTITGEMATNGSVAIYMSEVRGLDWTFQGNNINWAGVPVGRGAFIDVGGNTSTLAAHTVKGGVFRIEGNRFRWDINEDSVTISPIVYVDRGSVVTEPIHILIKNNSIVSTRGRKLSACYINIYASSVKPIDFIDISGNDFSGAALCQIRNSTNANFSALSVNVSNNTCCNASVSSDIYQVKDSVTVVGNTVFGSPYYALIIGGGSASIRRVTVSNNNFAENNTVISGSSTNNTSLYITGVINANCQGNVLGSNVRALTVASNTGYLVGETVTGATTGFTAEVVGLSGGGTLLVKNQSGTIGVENITGGTSSATTAVSANASAAAYAATYTAINNLWVGNNAKLYSLSDYESTVTAKVDFDAL